MYGGQVDDHGGRTGRPAWCDARQREHLPHGSEARGESSTPSTSTPFEPVGRLVEDLLGPGQDCAVGGVPGEPQRLREPCDGHGLTAQGPQPPTRLPSGSDGSRAQPGRSCPASTLGGSECRRSVSRAPPAAWASTPPARGSGAGPPPHPDPARHDAQQPPPRPSTSHETTRSRPTHHIKGTP